MKKTPSNHYVYHDVNTTYRSFATNLAKLINFAVEKCFSNALRQEAWSVSRRSDNSVAVSSVSAAAPDLDLESEEDNEEDDGVTTARFLVLVVVVASSSSFFWAVRGRLLLLLLLLLLAERLDLGAKKDVIIMLLIQRGKVEAK